MRVKHRISGAEYDALIFNGENFPYSHKHEAGETCQATGGELKIASYEVELDSPVGAKVQAHISAGAILLTDVEGKVTSCAPKVFSRDYEEVPE